MAPEFSFVAATESELNELLSGRRAGHPMAWPARHALIKLATGTFGVVFRQSLASDSLVRPLVLVAHYDEQRRLFARFAQVRADFSPLSAWCHVLVPNRFENLDSLTRETDLGGFEAAWSGLIIAESLLLIDRPISKLRIAACFATQTFGVARAKALWASTTLRDITTRFDVALNLFKASEQRTTRLRSSLDPIWSALSSASMGQHVVADSEQRPIVEGLLALNLARRANDPEEAARLVSPLAHTVPEVRALERLSQLTPEQRVNEFDKIVARLDANPQVSGIARQALTLTAGYIATVAAGGAPSLSLAENTVRKWPEITAWAYTLGGVGERVIWTSSFDGLGRLVARELTRPFRLDEPPTCDFALDEAIVLQDPKLTDPLVHLRIKQSRVVTTSLFPGVNISIAIADQPAQEARRLDNLGDRQRNEIGTPPGNDLAAALVEAIWPHLRAKMENANSAAQTGRGPYNPRSAQRNRGSRRQGSQAKLPLKDPTDD